MVVFGWGASRPEPEIKLAKAFRSGNEYPTDRSGYFSTPPVTDYDGRFHKNTLKNNNLNL